MYTSDDDLASIGFFAVGFNGDFLLEGVYVKLSLHGESHQSSPEEVCAFFCLSLCYGSEDMQLVNSF